MNPADFMAAFNQAASVPVTKPVVWPDDVPVEHPVRKLGLTTRFWPISVALHIQQLADAGEKGWLARTYWYVIAATICKPNGELAFCDQWTTIWQEHATAALAAYDKEVAAASDLADLPPRPTFQVDDSNQFVPPASPDYYIVGEWLKKKFDTAQGEALMKPMWSSSLDYNGWRAEDTKNSVTTDSSVPSGEKPTTEA